MSARMCGRIGGRAALVVVAALALLVLTVSARANAIDDHNRLQDRALASSSDVSETADEIVIERTRATARVGFTDALVVVVLSFALTTVLLRSDLVGRRRRRIGDDGDVWRSLLFGAPPVVA